ncbi:YjzD family protein [Pallidibacillus pasinlerensis]|uniref:YjzD family protein n=1 Tax=Pallidibacillus pasinlerensis TaxID=2703818 RepID=A0ABX0A2R4_9BACI|nr:YjzD family protein [Pallidibacillus pasinlerensis]NCU16590.1 YjzD family protein [Pallidibacillus pasinlerensis]
MRFIATLFWIFLFGHMIAYVGGSILGATYNFTDASILGVGIAVIVYLVSALTPEEQTQQEA